LDSLGTLTEEREERANLDILFDDILHLCDRFEREDNEDDEFCIVYVLV